MAFTDLLLGPLGHLEPFKGFLSGTPEKQQNYTRLLPQQQQLLDSLLPLFQQQLGSTNLDFAPFAQQSRNNFQTKTIPGLLEQFNSMGGGMNDLRSGAFASQLGAAAGQLDSNLAAQESQYNLSKFSTLGSFLPQLLQSTYDTRIQPQEPGLLHSLLPLLGTVGGSFLGGPAAGAGGVLTQLLSGLMGNNGQQQPQFIGQPRL